MKENKGEQPEQERDERVYRAADIASKKAHPSTQRQNYFREGFIEGMKYATAQPSKVQEDLKKENELLEEREVAWQNKHAFLMEEIEELKAWKESAISVMPDMQAIGKALNVPLGQSVHDKILPGIERLKEREDGELKRLIKAAYNEFNQFGTETTLTAIMDIVDLREALSQSKEGEDIDGEFRMILSHAFLGFDISDISKETFDLAISECVKYANKLLSKENEGKQVVWPSDEEIEVEIIARYNGNSRSNKIAKRSFIDAAEWIKSKQISSGERWQHKK